MVRTRQGIYINTARTLKSYIIKCDGDLKARHQTVFFSNVLESADYGSDKCGSSLSPFCRLERQVLDA